MPHSHPIRILAVIASLLYIIIFSIGGLAFSWMWLHWIIASIITFLAILFWPLFLYDTFKRPKRAPVFTGRIDHSGGGIGVVIGLVCFAQLDMQGNRFWAVIALVALTPILGITFSLLSESANCVIQRWRWERQ